MTTTKGSAHYAGLLPVGSPEQPPPIQPTTCESVPQPNPKPPLRKRASRALSRFVTTFGIGVIATLAWQSYGDAARQMIANSYPQLGWLAPRGASTAQKAPDTTAPGASLTLYPDHQQFDAMLRDFYAMSQSVERITVGQEEITRTIDQIATSIAAGQLQATRTADQPSTSVGQTSSADPRGITVEGRADRASSQPIVRSDKKLPEAKPPQTLAERKLASVAGGHDTSCLPSASAVLQNHPGAWPTWTLKAPGHEGTLCWYAATRPRLNNHRRELMPREE